MRTEAGHLQVFEREDHRLSEEHSAGLFVDGGSDYVGIDRQPPLFMARPVHFHLHRGVLGGQKGSKVFVENEHHLDLSCARSGRGGGKSRRMRRKQMNDKRTGEQE